MKSSTIFVWLYLSGKIAFSQLSGTVETVTFGGPITGRPVTFSIYFPPEYYTQATRKFPVVYHTHGANQSHSGPHTTAVPLAFESAKAYWTEFIVVFPDGYSNSMWADSFDGTKPAETNLIQEIIPYVDANFRTIPEKSHRMIQGFSMGGFGALKFYTKYPELFCRVILYDASLPDWEELNELYPSVAASVFHSDRSYFDQYSPWYHLNKNGGSFALDTMIEINIGALSFYGERLIDSLEAYKIPYKYLLTDCPHDIDCLAAISGAEAAKFFSRCLQSTPTGVEDDFLKNQQVTIHPNPGSNTIVINFSGRQHVRILSAIGQSLFDQEALDSVKVQVENFPLGLYFVQVGTKHVSSEKFIKQ